jgi:Na+-translocating ferredoxin:NAD+ oxidoreductase RnfG subunit
MVSFGQKPVNYEHKNIYKEIEKFWGLEQAALKEIYLPDSLVRKNHIQGKYFEVSSANGLNRPHYVYIGRVNSCRAGGCSISMDPMENYESEYFDYFILFNATCEVELVRVFNYAATHGHEIAAKGWLKQFTGHNGSDKLIVGKNVDAISGATISVYGITLDVQMKTEILKELHLLNLTRLIHKLKPVSR